MSRRSAAATGLAHAAPVFAALGDETRLALVTRLGSEGPQSITRLTDGSNVSRQAVTKHLKVLAGAGLVRDLRRGRERIWVVDSAPLDDARRYLEQVSSQWDAALQRLETFVEEDN